MKRLTPCKTMRIVNGTLLHNTSRLTSHIYPLNTLHFFFKVFLTLVCISRIPSTVDGFSLFSLLSVPILGIMASVIQLGNESSTGDFDRSRNLSKQSHDSSASVSITF